MSQVQTNVSKQGFARRNALVLAALALLLVVAVAVGATLIGQRSSLAAQQEQLSSLTRQISDAELAASEQADSDVLARLGYSRDRLAKDTAAVETFVNTVFTWSSAEEYEDARETLQTRFGLTEQDPFLTDFMSPARFNEDVMGNRYYQLDIDGLNSSVGSNPRIEIVSVSTGNYRYAVVADVAVTLDAVTDGSGSDRSTAQQQVLLMLTVDAEGAFVDVSGVTPGTSARHSG